MTEGRSTALRRLLQHRMLRRILAGTGSNAYAQATTIAIQLISLPLFLSRWDLATYGQWMVLSAIPGYLAMADVGMVTAAGNRMTMLIGEGNVRLANEVFQSALAFILAVCGAVMVILLLGVVLWPADETISADAREAIALLSAGVVVTLIGGLPEAVYKATHRYALGAALANTTRLFEWAGSLVGLWLSGSFVGVALGALVPRVLCTAGMILHTRRTTPDFRWNFADASRAEVRRSAGPAISFMAFPIANALNFQGMTLVAASVLGPANTVIFNTYRTLARVTVQVTSPFSLALWPEFSRLFGQGDLRTLGRLYRRSWWLALGLAAAASLVVYLAAPYVLKVWSKGNVPFMPTLMLVSMMYAAVSGAWYVSRVLLLSTNEHRGLAWPFLVASAACLPLAWLLAQSIGLIGVVLSMLILEIGMMMWCSYLSRRMLSIERPAKTVGAVA